MNTRWRIAYALNRLPRMCWSDLVGWALYREPTIRDCRIDWACRSDLDRNGSCYCGKLRLSSPESTEPGGET